MLYTILIGDDSVFVRRSLRACIEQDGQWEVCGEAEDSHVAVEKVREVRPDAVILDLQMPVMNGLQAARDIKTFAPATAMVMFTKHNADKLLQDARAAGIQEVISKSEVAAEHLLAALKTLSARFQI